MSDLPKAVFIKEEGPREGFQFEKGDIPTARKIELIDSLSKTGLKEIQVVVDLIEMDVVVLRNK